MSASLVHDAEVNWIIESRNFEDVAVSCPRYEVKLPTLKTIELNKYRWILVEYLRDQMKCISIDRVFYTELVKLCKKVYVNLVLKIATPINMINFGHENYPN